MPPSSPTPPAPSPGGAPAARLFAPNLTGFGSPGGHLAAPPAVPRATPAPVPTFAVPPVTLAPPSGSSVAAFDRPQAVVIVGPKPVPVSVVNGGGSGALRPTPTTPRRPGWIPRAQRLATRAIRGAGSAAAGIARNQAMPAFNAAVGAATTGLSRLGPVGLAASAGIQVAAEGVKAFSTVLESFAARGRELSGMNANLAASSARADVMRLQADIREANELGAKMGELIEKQAALEATVREILLPIKSFIIDGLVSILNAILAAVEGTVAAVDSLPLVDLTEMLEEIRRIRRQLEGDPAARGADLLTPILNAVEKLPLGPPVAPLVAPHPGPLAVPIVGGIL